MTFLQWSFVGFCGQTDDYFCISISRPLPCFIFNCGLQTVSFPYRTLPSPHTDIYSYIYIYIANAMSWRQEFKSKRTVTISSQIAKFMGPTSGPPGSCRPQMGPLLAPWTLLLYFVVSICHSYRAPWSQPNRSSKSISFATILSTTQHIEPREKMTRPSSTRLKSFVRLNLLCLTDYQYFWTIPQQH